jgi:hypothetical protein
MPLFAIPLIAAAAIGGGSTIAGALISKSGKNKTPPVDPQQQALADQQKKFADYGFPAAQANFAKAGSAYDTSLDFYKKILTGNDDEIMKLFNASEATKSADESDATAYGLTGRSGARSAVLANTTFNRQANLQNILEQIRLNAPGQIANVGQAIANMGAQQGSLASGSNIASSNILFQQQELAQQAADRRAQLIAGIIGAAGSVAGAIAAHKS